MPAGVSYSLSIQIKNAPDRHEVKAANTAQKGLKDSIHKKSSNTVPRSLYDVIHSNY